MSESRILVGDALAKLRELPDDGASSRTRRYSTSFPRRSERNSERKTQFYPLGRLKVSDSDEKRLPPSMREGLVGPEEWTEETVTGHLARSERFLNRTCLGCSPAGSRTGIRFRDAGNESGPPGCSATRAAVRIIRAAMAVINTNRASWRALDLFSAAKRFEE